MNREEVEKHWEYSAELMNLSGHPPTEREHYLYVEAMLHGAKHEEDNRLRGESK